MTGLLVHRADRWPRGQLQRADGVRILAVVAVAPYQVLQRAVLGEQDAPLFGERDVVRIDGGHAQPELLQFVQMAQILENERQPSA